MLSSSLHKSFLEAALERAGLPDIRFHDLRRSAATILLSMGVHPKVATTPFGAQPD
jgi:integrase